MTKMSFEATLTTRVAMFHSDIYKIYVLRVQCNDAQLRGYINFGQKNKMKKKNKLQSNKKI